MICPHCHTKNPDRNNFCIQCGVSLRNGEPLGERPRQAPATFRVANPSEYVLCPSCQQPQGPGKAYCSVCGASLDKPPVVIEPKRTGSCLGKAIRWIGLVGVSFLTSLGIGLVASQFGISNFAQGALTCLISSGIPMTVGFVILMFRMVSKRISS